MRTKSNTERVVIANMANGQKHFATQRKNSMTRAVAIRFLHELILTEKWDYLFKEAGVKATDKSFAWGPINEADGYVSAFSLGRLPRIVAPDFLIRIEETDNTLSPDFDDGSKKFRFYGLDRNDSISVSVAGSGANWKPVAVQAFLFGSDTRPYSDILVTDYLPINS